MRPILDLLTDCVVRQDDKSGCLARRYEHPFDVRCPLVLAGRESLECSGFYQDALPLIAAPGAAQTK
jgi:hypothetical protein